MSKTWHSGTRKSFSIGDTVRGPDGVVGKITEIRDGARYPIYVQEANGEVHVFDWTEVQAA